MRYLLIPIKDLTNAKQRLSPVLGPLERMALATLMLRRTLDIVTGVELADRIAVVTCYPPAMSLASGQGLEVIVEERQISESHSVDFGSKEVMRRGATAVLRLPIDLPLVTAADIDTILAADDGREQVVLVPSRDGTGTNAILRRPPDLIRSCFGPNSLEEHRTLARKAGIPCLTIENSNIAFDVDDPADLEACRRAGLL